MCKGSEIMSTLLLYTTKHLECSDINSLFDTSQKQGAAENMVHQRGVQTNRRDSLEVKRQLLNIWTWQLDIICKLGLQF